jgi:hypothetical protein
MKCNGGLATLESATALIALICPGEKSANVRSVGKLLIRTR